MARQDEILRNFLNHEVIKNKYDINEHELPNTVLDALNSEKPIIKGLGIIVNSMETSFQSENQIYKTLTLYLNSVAL